MARPSTARILFLLAATVLLGCAAAQPAVLITGKVTVMDSDLGRDLMIAAEDAKGKASYRKLKLPFNFDSSDMRTGDTVSVNVVDCASCPITSPLTVVDLRVLEKAPVPAPFNGTNLQAIGEAYIPTIVFILDQCGLGAAASPNDVRNTLFGMPRAPGRTVQKMHSECSFGRSRFDAAQVKVVDTIIPVPCQGETVGAAPTSWVSFPFDTTTGRCENPEVTGIAKYAEWYYANVLKQNDLGKYYRRVLVMSARNTSVNNCPFGGLGVKDCYLGPWPGCYSWIIGSSALSPRVWFHELLHNLGLGHARGYAKDDATDSFNEYNDRSDVMGCCETSCTNAPHMNLLGWANPVARLNNQSLSNKGWITYTIPARMTSRTNHVVVTPSWIPNTDPERDHRREVYISYQTRHSEDREVQGMYNNKVMVHSMMNNWMGNSAMEGILDVGDVYNTNAPTAVASWSQGLMVQVLAKGATFARVRVCLARNAADCPLTTTR